MTIDDAFAEPAAESLAEMPEVDFSNAVRPNRYANLSGEFRHAVFLEPEPFAHFGSAEKIGDALRLLRSGGQEPRAGCSLMTHGGGYTPPSQRAMPPVSNASANSGSSP